MAKFILIDQSISSIAGHHYEYAMHVLEAAQRAGYEPFLATHTRFSKSSQHSPWRTFPFYRYGFWSAQGAPQSALLGRLIDVAGALRFRWRLFYHYSLFGLVWAVRDRFGEFLLKQPLDKAHVASLASLVPLAILVKLLRFAGLLLLLPVMLLVFLGRSLVRILKAGGFPISYARALLADAADAYRLLRDVFHRRNQMLSWWQQRRCVVGFQKDTARLMRDIRPGPGDVIFLPTVSAIELMGLAELLKKRPAGPTWHLLFRRDIYKGRESSYASQDGALNGLRQVFLNSAAKLRNHAVRFYTDTHELTAQYNRLDAFPFRTLPIPHTHPPARAARTGDALRMVYVGDARSEKGYHRIPHLIEDLWHDYILPGRAIFQLQSNFNIPRGEPEAVIAREQLEQLALRAPSAIILHKQPLTSTQYRDFLLAGDINLLLYDPVNYYARSSGILVEALSAGMPVIVPGGCWLSRQFRGAVKAYQSSLAETMQVLHSGPLGEYRWRVHGSPNLSAESNGVVTASHTARAYTWARVPAGSSRFLVRLTLAGGASEAALYVTAVDARGNMLPAAPPRIVEAGESGEAIELYGVDRHAARLWIAVAPLDAMARVVIPAAEFSFLACLPGQPPPPRSAVGAVYHDPSEISAWMRELIDHYPHYAATAREFSKSWRDYHNAAKLVAELAGNPARAAAVAVA